jgi:hypothetical protein
MVFLRAMSNIFPFLDNSVPVLLATAVAFAYCGVDAIRTQKASLDDEREGRSFVHGKFAVWIGILWLCIAVFMVTVAVSQ